MSSHSASYYSQWDNTHQNDPEKGERVCDHRHCISLAESACDYCARQFCDNEEHGTADATFDPPICWHCRAVEVDRSRDYQLYPQHCTVLYTEADLCQPYIAEVKPSEIGPEWI